MRVMVPSARQIRSVAISGLGAVMAVAGGVRSEADAPRVPRLVVVVVVDGLMPDQLDRYSDLYVGGLRRLLNEGAVLDSCFHEHASTETGPGHFVLLSGRYPGPAGVVGNSWYDPGLRRRVYCVEDSLSFVAGTSRRAGSYRHVAASTLGDWLKLEVRRAKVFSIAPKDRAAVMMGGRTADGVYWYDAETGRFVTSTFYASAPHPWVDAFNDSKRPEAFWSMEWERLLTDTSVYETRAGPDDFPGEGDCSTAGTKIPPGAPVFDHVIGGGGDVDTLTFRRAFRSFPWIDEYTIELARIAIVSELLGSDDAPDLLAIGLPSLDSSNHIAGPQSQESMDVVLRVDRLLGGLMQFLDSTLGEDRYALLLSADHGFAPLPEQASRAGVPGMRVRDEPRAFAERVRAAFRERCPGREAFSFATGTDFYLDREAIGSCAIDADEVESVLRMEALKESWVARIISRRELTSRGKVRDRVLERFRHSYDAACSPDFVAVPKPGVLIGGATGSDHGSPYDYDAHVPAVLMGPGVEPGRRETRAATVDLAPTLAALLRLRSVPEVDGSPLRSLFQPEVLSE